GRPVLRNKAGRCIGLQYSRAGYDFSDWQGLEFVELRGERLSVPQDDAAVADRFSAGCGSLTEVCCLTQDHDLEPEAHDLHAFALEREAVTLAMGCMEPVCDEIGRYRFEVYRNRQLESLSLVAY